jgi:hypothetical protein
MLLSCQDVPQNCQPSDSLARKNQPPKDHFKLTVLLAHTNMLKRLQLQLTVHQVKNMRIHIC